MYGSQKEREREKKKDRERRDSVAAERCKQGSLQTVLKDHMGLILDTTGTTQVGHRLAWS